MKLRQLRKRKSIVYREYDLVEEITENAANKIIGKGFDALDFKYLRKHVVKGRLSEVELNETILQCFYNLGIMGLVNKGCVSDVLAKDEDPKNQARADIWLYLVSTGLVTMCFGNEKTKTLNRYRATKKFRKLFGYV